MPRTKISALAALLLLVVTVAGCGGGGGDSDAEVKAKVADQMVEKGLDKEAADCFADLVADKVGAEEIQDIDFSSDEPAADLEDDLAEAAKRALTTCKIDMAELNG